MSTDPPDYNPEAGWEAGGLAGALAKVQGELKAIDRNQHGQVGPREYDYADLAAVSAVVLPLLGQYGLAFMCRPTRASDGQMVLAYSLLHTSGEREDGEYLLGTGTHQQLGSAITYGRRYCLCAVTGAVAEADLDGAEAPQVKQPRQQQRPKPRAEANGDGQLAKDQPGSAPKGLVTSVQIRYQELGFKRTERDDMLSASEQIIGRPLTGPNDGRTHNNLSEVESRKLRDTLGGFKDRGDLVAALVEAATS